LGDYLCSHPWILDDAESLCRTEGYWNFEDASFEFMVAEVREALREDYCEQQVAGWSDG